MISFSQHYFPNWKRKPINDACTTEVLKHKLSQLILNNRGRKNSISRVNLSRSFCMCEDLSLSVCLFVYLENCLKRIFQKHSRPSASAAHFLDFLLLWWDEPSLLSSRDRLWLLLLLLLLCLSPPLLLRCLSPPLLLRCLSLCRSPLLLPCLSLWWCLSRLLLFEELGGGEEMLS